MRQPRKKGSPAAEGQAVGERAGERKNLPAQGRALFANASNDITIPHYSRSLRPTDDLLIRRGRGIELYREARRDGRVYTVLQKRKRALIAREWTVEPASEDAVDRRAAAIVESQLQRLPFDALTLDLLDAVLMGFSVSEIVWDRDGAEIVASRVVKIDQRRIIFDLDWEPRLLTQEEMLDGLAFPPRKAIVHRFDEDDRSDPYGFGLGRILFWHTLFKREGVSFWLKALERFAVPLPVAKYPFGTLPADQQRLLDALSGAVAGGALAVPSGTEIDFAKAALSGTLTHEGWCRYWDEQTAETVLGETLTTNVGSAGSKAASETHKDIRDELIDGDADLVTATLSESLVGWITEYNVPDAQPPAVRRPRPANVLAEETAAARRAERQAKDIANVAALRREGFEPQDLAGAFTEIMGRPIVVSTRPPPRPEPASSTALTPAFAGPGAGTGVAGLGSALTALTSPFRARWYEQVAGAIDALIAEGGDLADLPARLLTLYPELETEDLGRVIGEALSLAELKGRADLLDELGDDAP
jgi:phage gp29-like protein